ncbi:hypothetical protein Pcinc_037759 [Petrolisthes cinctipes]|uniref:Uncharacterized protein n=1 Tax=Petrolisthes cinctipes TaxID=88211 RepID=A0AAE1BVC6_PETCI|nr:hypothetical protein Pcinc_037759 [Petrolisthes cinctipes]
MLTPDVLYRCALATPYTTNTSSRYCSTSRRSIETHSPVPPRQHHKINTVTDLRSHHQQHTHNSVSQPQHRGLPIHNNGSTSVSSYSDSPYSALALLLLQPAEVSSSVQPVEEVTGGGDRCTTTTNTTTWVPLKLLRRYYTLHLRDNMTAHLCITTYKSPHNEVLKLEVGRYVGR